MSLPRLVTLAGLWFAIGCAGNVTPPQPSSQPPLTIEQWKNLPVEEKYDEAILQSLRDAAPNLRADRNWQRFLREVVLPERKRDIPGIPGQAVPGPAS